MNNGYKQELVKRALDEEYDQKEFSLVLAVIFWDGVHASGQSNPTSPGKVVETARTFYNYLYQAGGMR